MAQFLIFIYGMLAVFVIQEIARNRRMQRPTSHVVTMVGWGLFSLSSTLALLMAGLAVAMAFGFQPPMQGLAAAAS